MKHNLTHEKFQVLTFEQRSSIFFQGKKLKIYHEGGMDWFDLDNITVILPNTHACSSEQASMPAGRANANNKGYSLLDICFWGSTILRFRYKDRNGKKAVPKGVLTPKTLIALISDLILHKPSENELSILCRKFHIELLKEY